MDNFSVGCRLQIRNPLLLNHKRVAKRVQEKLFGEFFLKFIVPCSAKKFKRRWSISHAFNRIEALVVDLFALQGIAWYLVLKNWQGWVEPQASMLWRGKGVPRNQRLYAFGNDTSVCSASYLGMVCQLAAREGESYHKVLNEGWMMSLRRRRITHKYVAKHRKRVRNGHLCEYTGGRNRMDESRKGRARKPQGVIWVCSVIVGKPCINWLWWYGYHTQIRMNRYQKWLPLRPLISFDFSASRKSFFQASRFQPRIGWYENLVRCQAKSYNDLKK